MSQDIVLFGRTTRRNNQLPDPDGSTDPTSAAFSPLITRDNTRPVRVVMSQPDTFPTLDQTATGSWGPETGRPLGRGIRETVDQTVGGRPGNGNVLGWSTGLMPRRESSTPLTGRVLRGTPMGVHPNIGQVGRDNRANRLFAAVASQQTDYQPMTTGQIAAQFTGRGITLE